MKLKHILIVPLFFCLINAKAQSTDIKKTIYDSFTNGGGLGPQGVIFFSKKIPAEQRSLLFSVVIKTNKFGEIESLGFTKSSPLMDSVVSVSRISAYLKSDRKKDFLGYKNAYIIAPVWIRDIEGSRIETTREVLNSFDELIPKDKTDKRRYVLSTMRFDIGKPSH